MQQFLQYKPTGKRDVGRPRQRWKMTSATEEAVMASLEVVGDDDDKCDFHLLQYFSNRHNLLLFKNIY
jgi:hypothetical protein